MQKMNSIYHNHIYKTSLVSYMIMNRLQTSNVPIFQFYGFQANLSVKI